MVWNSKNKKIQSTDSMVSSDSDAINLKKKRRPKKILVVFVVVVIVALAIGGVFLYKHYKKPSTNNIVPELLKSDTSDSAKQHIVEEYNAKYSSTTSKASGTSPNKWDKATLDDAYTSLLYADKIGAFTQVYNMLAQIDAAQKSGLNIDNNSYGITQAMRDTIKSRADTASKVALSGEESK